MQDKKPKSVFKEGAITSEFIGNSIYKHQTKTSIGAHNIFLGQVRADDIDEKTVMAIEYTAYEDMANAKFHEIREAAFEQFDYKKIAEFKDDKILELNQDAGIIRNKLKIASAVNNAQRFIEIQKEFGSFSNYIWAFVDNKPIDNKPKTLADVPATTPLSDKISKDLKKRGFKFVGSTVIYAHMQATGMVNDHVMNCWTRK